MKQFARSLADLEDRLTVRQQVGIAAAILCVAVVAAVAASAIFLGREQAKARINDEMQRLASVMADRADRYMYLRHREMTLVTQMPSVRNLFAQEPARIREVLDHLQSVIPDYTWIGFTRPDGIVAAASKGMLEGVSVASRPWFMKGLQGPTTQDVHEAQLLSKLLGNDESGEPFRFVDVAIPVRAENGTLLGVLGAHFSWTWAHNLRRSLIGETQGSEHIDIWILSSDGRVVLGPADAHGFSAARMKELQSRRQGAFTDEHGDERVLTGFATADGEDGFSGLNWTVLARTPEAVALASANVLALYIAGFGVAAALIGLALAIWIARRVSAPLLELEEAADRIGRSKRAEVIPRQRGSLDVIRLSTALRSLVRRLGTAEQRGDAAELLAAENAQQYIHDVKLLRKLANTDPLTGLLNRRAFNGFAEDAMDYFKRYRRSIAILIIDIDRFKGVNDTFGHAAGDAVINRVGELITRIVRSTDKVARFGGEEFVVLLRESDETEARRLAERIRTAIAAETIHVGGRQLFVTVSIGGSTVTETDRDIQDVIQRADLGLYVAKNGGRNRTAILPAGEHDREAMAA